MDVRALTSRYGDALLAAVIATGMVVELIRWSDDDLLRSIGAGLLASAPLTVRRRHPLVSFVLVMLGIELIAHLEPGFDNDSMAFVVAFFLSLYSLGRHATGTEAWLGVVGVIVAMVSFVDGEGGFGQTDPGDIAFVLVFVGAPWAAGLALRLKRERETTLGAENERLVREQELRAQRAVAEERVADRARAARRRLPRDLGDGPPGARRPPDAGHRPRDRPGVRSTPSSRRTRLRSATCVGCWPCCVTPRPTARTRLGGRHAPQPSLDAPALLVGHVRESGAPGRASTVSGDAAVGAAGRRPLGVPHRPGGAHQRPQARAAGRGAACCSSTATTRSA